MTRCHCAFHRRRATFDAFPVPLLVRRDAACEVVLLTAYPDTMVCVVAEGSVLRLGPDAFQKRFGCTLEDTLIMTPGGIARFGDATHHSMQLNGCSDLRTRVFSARCSLLWSDASQGVRFECAESVCKKARTSAVSAYANGRLIEFFRRPDRLATIRDDPTLLRIEKVDHPYANHRGVQMQLPLYTCVFGLDDGQTRTERLSAPLLCMNPAYRHALEEFKSTHTIRCLRQFDEDSM